MAKLVQDEFDRKGAALGINLKLKHELALIHEADQQPRSLFLVSQTYALAIGSNAKAE